MAKLLAITAIVSAVTAALAALVFVDAAQFVAVAVALAAGVILILQKRLDPIVGGAVVLLLAILGLIANIGNITTKGGGGGGLGIDHLWAPAFLTAALVLVPAVAAWTARASLPAWAVYLAMGLGVLTAILAFVGYENLVNQTNGMTLAIGVLCLLNVAPGVLMLRSPELAAAPVAAEEPASRKAAKRKAD